MKNNQSKHNWVVDAILFTGFVLAYWMDLTGLPLHQWLGIGVAVLSGYHLIAHWKWVKVVTQRFFGKLSAQSRIYYLIDGGMLAGLGMITLTGLVISTWFNLSLTNYDLWKNVHVLSSIGTLALTLVKIGLHWKWIVQIARRIFSPAPKTAIGTPAPVAVAADPSRRDFLRLMGVVGVASVFAMSKALKGLSNAVVENEQVQASAPVETTTTTTSTSNTAATTVQTNTAVPTAAQTSSTVQTQATAVPTAAPTATVQTVQILPTTAASTACRTCRKGRHCSYPGDCHSYTDANSNGLCDLGECG